MKKILFSIAFCAVALFFVSTFFAQGRGVPQVSVDDLIEKHDGDENGRLTGKELDSAIKEIKANPQRGRGRGGPPGFGGRGGRGPGGPGGRGRGGPRGRGGGPPGGRGPGASGERVVNKPGRKVKRENVETYTDKDLYDDSVMRTMFIDVDRPEWESDMALLKDYGIDVPSNVTVDGKTYPNVGLRFRGNSSFFSVGAGQKRSLNLSFDWEDKNQDLMGYSTINLLNSHADASYLRLVMYSQIAGSYTAAPQASYVHVVINGESWGVYINEEQFNSEFTERHLGAKKGSRFKAPPGGTGASFVYSGDKKSSYSSYELKTKDNDETWEALIKATKTLDETPAAKIETDLDEVISVDRALWMHAIDNVLLDMDGYYSRGADYAIFQDAKFERFHILPYDNNETFRAQGGGHGGPGGPGGPPGGGFRLPFFGGPQEGGGPGGGGPPANFHQVDADAPPFALDIFASADEPRAPLISKLLRNPAVKARYVAHVRTIYKQWIDWKTVEPMLKQYRDLIKDELRKDTRSLTSFQAFNDGIGMSEAQGRDQSPGLKAFFKGRKQYLDSVPELQQPAPGVESLEAKQSKGVVTLQAKLDKDSVQPDKVFAYFSNHKLAKFKQVEMKADSNGGYAVQLPKQVGGNKLYYYVEARTSDKYLTTSFFPKYAEGKPKSIRVEARVAKSSSLQISKLMASNDKSVADKNGEFDDWIEIVNSSNESQELSGMYLSDTQSDLKKWAFPDSTKLGPGKSIVVWADGDKDQEGHHANFKLSKSGETIFLSKSTGDDVEILSKVKYQKLKNDQVYVRNPGGTWKVEEFSTSR